MLPAATQAEILRLHYAEGWAHSRIAQHLGVNRKSVRKVVRRRSVALAPAPPRPRGSLLTPFHARLQALLAQDPERPAVDLLQVLRGEGDRGGVTLRAGRALGAFRRCHEHAFAFFAGCGRELWYDNLASAVAERRGRLVR